MFGYSKEDTIGFMVVIFIILLVLFGIISLVYNGYKYECETIIRLNGDEVAKWENGDCYILNDGLWLPSGWFKEQTQYIPMPIVVPVH